MLGPFLDMPAEELPGDSNMPRVQGPTSGASERFAVSPGREQEGYMHMPTGQSGHPLSPHYRDANAANMLDMLDLRRPAFLAAPTLAQPLVDTDPSALACNVSGPGTIPPPGSITPG